VLLFCGQTHCPLALHVWPARQLPPFVPQVIVPPHTLANEPQTRLPHEVGVHPHVLGVPLPPHVFGEVHFVPHPPQLELSVPKLVQALLQKFGLLAFEQTQLPVEHVLPVVVQSTQLEAEPQLWESLELS
jgi:hypothetical protein